MRHKDPELMRMIREYAERYHADNFRSPSTAEIARGVGAAKSTVYRYLVEMDEKGMISYDGRDIVTGSTRKMAPGFNRAAVIGDISCGQLNLAEENIQEYVLLPESIFGQGDFYILTARGESMIEAGIDDGDLVVIKKQDYADEGEIIVALVDCEATLKRYFRDEENHRVILHPENRSMDDIFVDDCNIQGVAVRIIKKVD